jgi:hypothetical protein
MTFKYLIKMNSLTLYLRKNSILLLLSLCLISCETQEKSPCPPSIKQGLSGHIKNNDSVSVYTVFISNADFDIPRLSSFEKTLDYLRKVDNSHVFPIEVNQDGCFEKFLTAGNYKISIIDRELKYRILPDSIIKVYKDSISSLTIEVY